MISLFTLLSSIDPGLLSILLVGIIIVIIGSILRHYKQPYIIAYILTGVLLGQHGFNVLPDEKMIHILGEFGLILLLFFIGMEINLPDLIKNWKIPLFGTILQILFSVLIVFIIGSFLEWSLSRVVVLGFVISLSSSAIVIKLLQENDEIKSKIGQSVISILLMQDILIVPMLLATNYLGGNAPPREEILLQIVGAIMIIGGIIWMVKKEELRLPFGSALKDDHELQVIYALIICFGCSTLSAIFGLSAALGGFVGGMFIHASKSTEWFHESLHSFRVVFVSLFFISIGMLIDINFLISNWQIILMILLAVYISNQIINSMVLFYFLRNWKESLYGGALLAQVGELSFLLASSAYFTKIISEFAYQLAIIVISLTLLLSPFWIAMTKRFINK